MQSPSLAINLSENVAYLTVRMDASFVRNSPQALLWQGLELNCIQDTIWLTCGIGSENLSIACVYCPTGPFRNDLVLTTDTINYCSTMTGPKIVAEDFDAPGVLPVNPYQR